MSNPSTGDSKRGIDVLRDPSINKSTGFTEAERQTLGLVGLVPDVTESIETQLSRVLLQLKHKASDLDRFIYLMNLLDTNETLFYRTLMSDPARFLEFVYALRRPAATAPRKHATADALDECGRLLRNLQIQRYWGDYGL